MRDVVAELVGTFVLVFAIVASIMGSLAVTNGVFGAANVLIISFTAGLVLAVLILSLGQLSGGHFNPAVTIGLLAAGKFDVAKAVPYVIAQLVGGILAAVSLFIVVSADFAGATMPGSFGVGAAFVMEAIATAIFVIVILSVSGRKEAIPGIPSAPAIGFFLLVAHLFAIPFSGASLNPARSLGPALLAGNEAILQLWIYFAGPIIGAIIGALAYVYLLEPRES